MSASIAAARQGHEEAEARHRLVPASVGQASLWFLRQLMPCKTPYNTAIEHRLSGELAEDALVAAVREVARRHESLRTTFTVRDGAVLQAITEGGAPDVSVVDLASFPHPEAEARRVAVEIAGRAFDLDRGPLLRVRLLRLGPRDHALVVVIDHLVADGLSLGILWREISALYGAFRAGAASPLPPVRAQLAPYAEAQRAWLATEEFARQLGYWKQRLAGVAACALPEDRPRPPIKSYRGGMERTRLPRALVERLRALGAEEGVSLFTLLLTALDLLLARTTGERDIAVMIAVACRQRLATPDVVGFFSNMIVLRTLVADDDPFRGLLRRVNAEVMKGLLRQDVPFEKVIEALRPVRSLSHYPLARVALSFLPAPAAALELPGIAATYVELPNGGAKFDLHLTVTEHADDLSAMVEYNSDVFEPASMTRLLERYQLLLEAACADPGAPVADLPWLPPAARHRMLVEWNDTRASWPRAAGLHDLVAAAAERSAEAIAVSCEGQEITYAELLRRSRRVARCLRARGVGPEVLVGIAVERSIAMVVGLLGILEAGGAYVPLDPAYPRDRLAFMAEDSALHVLVTQDRFADLVPRPAGGLLRLDADAEEIASRSDAPLDLAVSPESLAYVIYTSGSTGDPRARRSRTARSSTSSAPWPCGPASGPRTGCSR